MFVIYLSEVRPSHMQEDGNWVPTFRGTGFPGGWAVKNPPANAGDAGLIPGLGRCPGEGNGNPLQYSCWKVPWTEKPGGLQYMGLQKIWTLPRNYTTTTKTFRRRCWTYDHIAKPPHILPVDMSQKQEPGTRIKNWKSYQQGQEDVVCFHL